MPNLQKNNGVRRALSLSFIQRLVTLVFSFGGIVLISRLLTPAEVGVFSIAAGLVALIHMLRDFGVSEFVVQESMLDDASVRTVFTLNLIIAWCLGAALFAASGAIGGFYSDAGVARVLRVLSLVFVLLPFGTTTMALLNREMEFGKLATIRIGESVIRSCTAVGLAYAGFSYMSMAWSALVGIIVMIVGSMVFARDHRIKGFGLANWRRVLHFGSNRTIADLAQQLGSQSPNLIIGKMLGMGDVGLFSRGYGIVNMYRTNIIGAIGSVAFPAFAREHREYAKAPELFLKALIYTTGISWPFFACATILAYPVINIMFGDQWDAAVPLMRWLCSAAMVGTLIYQCDGFLIALGRSGTVTRVMLKYQLARVGISIAAAFYSLEAVAAVEVLVYVLAVVLYYRQLRIYEALSFGKCTKALIPSAVVTLATCIVPLAVVLTPGFVVQHMVPAFAVAFVGGCTGWLLAVVLAQHPLLDELKRVIVRFPRFHFLLRG